ncbi:SusC/RagA family TonB-linked outer membrane protein [Chitinophaga sp. S165]|uniref:SusC/RagA family TonB-linked outer membrane protein n=1 Tax=Chitinophaga sp. S165 TaxID=2135462 RepID=UPI000D715BEC|nr:SusC/RagA family TonB-linked outer membrane protein [Chitinophaga sp. S165]PWV45801.1 TonB-linked SusC/RagA family outer membrane protein [Chitinophaga sp. S165]
MFRCNVKRPSLHALLVVILCLCTYLQSTARLTPLQGKEISISVKKSSLSNILNQISKKSGITIYFVDNDLAAYTNIDYDAKDKQVVSILAELFKGRDLLYEVISEKQIGVRKVLKKSHLFAPADTLSVSGKVIDEKGGSIAGATIIMKGNTRLGTMTNSKGEFILEGVTSDASLIISSVSFLTTEVAVQGRFSIGVVRLKEYVGVLDAVQVQAYGTTSRRLSTGNIMTVSGDEIARSPVSNPLLAINGRVPGVFIQQSSGVPGAGVKVLIQGQNSMQNDNDPFYVIDGVPYTSQLLPSLANELGQSGSGTSGIRTSTQGNPLSFINPQDIENISVLKDADATSIYGSRAANGAIIITTKKGRAGQTSVNASFEQGWQTVPRMLKLLNTQEYLAMRKEGYINDNKQIPTVPGPGVYDLTFWDQNKYTDWQKELIGGRANYTNAQLSLSGGSRNTNVLASFAYLNQGSVTPGNLSDKKASVHFNLSNTSENKKFGFNLIGNYVFDNNQLASVNAFVNSAFTRPPNAPDLRSADGTLNWAYLPNNITPTMVGSLTNPLVFLERKYINKTSNLISNALITYQPIAGLEIKSSFGYNKLESEEIRTNPLSSFPPNVRQNVTRTAGFNNAEISSWIIEPQMTYSRSFKDNKIDFLVGATLQHESRDRQYLNASGFTSDQSMLNIKAASTVIVDPETDAVILSKYKYNAVFSRLTYNLANKYIINGTIRRDGSSRFGGRNKFHNFASIAGAWIFSSETFLKENIPAISFGKVRASYGTTGNDQIGDYGYLNLYGNTSTGGTSYQGIIGLEPYSGFPNPHLQWEETKKFSTSLELGFLSDRLLFGGTYYRNTCTNQLLNVSIVTITGGTNLIQNRPAKVQNSGFELSFNSINLALSKFKWTSSINLTIPRNKLVSYGDVDADVNSDLIGKSLAVTKLYKYMGVDPTTGLYSFEDHEGKLTSNPDGSIDRTVYIDLNPKYYGGVQNSFTYNGVSLDILFQFVKQKSFNSYFGVAPGVAAANQVAYVLDRWQKIGDQASIQKFSTTVNTTGTAVLTSDRAVSDASFIRLKNISLSYPIPQSWINKARIKSGRLYIQGQNIITITDYEGGDPEIRTLTGLPPLKVVTFGLQLTI